jgi:hypothetical protein
MAGSRIPIRIDVSAVRLRSPEPFPLLSPFLPLPPFSLFPLLSPFFPKRLRGVA